MAWREVNSYHYIKLYEWRIGGLFESDRGNTATRRTIAAVSRESQSIWS
ncbi:hypothetical protein V0288_21680 [Pannus brasiliensis CCIBt3594]|uniref:Uncharacterized protein n=1 Tax=Pannus brasiliensis CCIBt3594 TaxID=1427578 RepID=A0AAW9QRU0_9CHRO